MNERLGALLVREGVITESQLEDALRDQVITGGRLGSNLVELGYLTADALTGILARHLGLPVLDEASLEHTPPGLFGGHARRLALYHQVLPLEATAREVRLGMVDPTDATAREAVEALTRRQAVVTVVPETLFWRYAERHYGLRRPERVSLDDPSRRLRRRDRAPWRPEYLSEAPEEAAPAAAPDRELFAWGADLGGPEIPEVRVGDRVPMSTVYDALAVARDRHEVAEAAKLWARGRVESLVLFVVEGDAASAWTGVVPGVDEARLSTISIPLERPSAFHEVIITRTAFEGAPPESLLQGRFHAWLGRATPRAVRVTPVLLGERLVNVIYVDAGDRPLPEGAGAELDALAAAMARAYARLIRAMRGR